MADLSTGRIVLGNLLLAQASKRTVEFEVRRAHDWLSPF
jgi:hypothetical protein